MRRAITTVAVCMVVGLASIPAWGDNPHYLSCSATFTVGCFTRKGNQVQGVPKSGSGEATSSTTLDVRNGQTTGTISLCPAAFDLPDPGCTGSQEQRTLSASYSS